jgi:hypothetical protein
MRKPCGAHVLLEFRRLKRHIADRQAGDKRGSVRAEA